MAEAVFWQRTLHGLVGAAKGLTMDAAGWQRRYATILESCQKHLSASESRQIADLGRTVFEAGVPAEDVAAAHIVCVKDLAATTRIPLDVLECTTVPFVELMKGYGAAMEAQRTRNPTRVDEAIRERERMEASVHESEELARLRQQELAHVTRLSTVGEMGTGLAHELNQPLFAISNYAEGSMRKLRSGGAAPEDLLPALQQIADQAQRAGEIIRHLKSFVRKGEPKWERVCINDLVTEVTRFVEPDARAHDVRLEVHLADKPHTVEGDVIQLQQVLVNLVRNGIEAMQGDRSGERVLIIRTLEIDVEELEVTVCDTGHGISNDLAGRIFDPFFSTKTGGLGMGLSISRTIVEAHGGRVWATPNPGRGTTFHLILPLRTRAEP